MRTFRFMLLNILHLPISSLVIAFSILCIISYVSLFKNTDTVQFISTTTEALKQTIYNNEEEIQFDKDLQRTVKGLRKPSNRRWSMQLQQHLDRIKDVDEDDWNKRLDNLYYNLLDGDPLELQQLGLAIDDVDMDDEDDVLIKDIQEYYQNRQGMQENSRDFIKTFEKNGESKKSSVPLDRNSAGCMVCLIIKQCKR